MICMSRAKFDRRIYLLTLNNKIIKCKKRISKVNFSFALWNFNSLLKCCYCSCITIFIVHKIYIWSQLIWYLAVYTCWQVILMMYEYVNRHVSPNQPLTARDAEPPPSGETTSARCVIDHQSEEFIITCIMLHTCS